MMEWIEKNLPTFFAIGTATVGLVGSISIAFHNINTHSKKLEKLESDIDRCMARACELNQEFNNQRNACSVDYVHTKEFDRFKKHMQTNFDKISIQITAADSNRDKARSEIADRWAEIREFMGRVDQQLKDQRRG